MMVLAALIGAFLRRAFGGGTGHPRGIKLLALAALAGIVCKTTTGSDALAFFVGSVTVAFWSMGHGSYMDMGTSPARDNERFQYMLDVIVGEEVRPSVTRDFIGMTIRYATPAALIAALYCLWGHWWALMLPLSGLAIATAYWAFSKVRGRLPYGSFLDGFTAYGELAAGAIFYGWLACL